VQRSHQGSQRPSMLIRLQGAHADSPNWTSVARVAQCCQFRQAVSDRITGLREIVANYNLPYLSLPAQTEKDVALDVFIKMSTDSKRCCCYPGSVNRVDTGVCAARRILGLLSGAPLASAQKARAGWPIWAP
jgi:hypothetical protein